MRLTACVRDLPLWVDLPTGKLFSRNANKGRKAFALAGQRIYLMGLSGEELQQNHIDWGLGNLRNWCGCREERSL